MDPVVLIVDDDHDTLNMTSELLRLEGFNVVTADNGREAIELAYLHGPAAILMDLGMPLVNGFDAVKVLCEDVQFSKTYIAALTGYGDERIRKELLESGFDDHFIKPADFPTLTAALKIAVKKHPQTKSADVRHQSW